MMEIALPPLQAFILFMACHLLPPQFETATLKVSDWGGAAQRQVLDDEALFAWKGQRALIGKTTCRQLPGQAEATAPDRIVRVWDFQASLGITGEEDWAKLKSLRVKGPDGREVTLRVVREKGKIEISHEAGDCRGVFQDGPREFPTITIALPGSAKEKKD